MLNPERISALDPPSNVTAVPGPAPRAVSTHGGSPAGSPRVPGSRGQRQQTAWGGSCARAGPCHPATHAVADLRVAGECDAEAHVSSPLDGDDDKRRSRVLVCPGLVAHRGWTDGEYVGGPFGLCAPAF